jgi:hypothetical protein
LKNSGERPQTAFDFLRATAARVYFPKYSNFVRKNLSTAQFGFLQFFMGHDTTSHLKNIDHVQGQGARRQRRHV